jgi:TP901-1 family phage major tail protein
MTQQKGRTLLLKRGDGGGTEAFATVCGITTRSISINNNEVDVTVPDCSTPGDKVLAKTAYGIQTLEFSGDGMFTDEAAHKNMSNDALNQALGNYQVVVPGWGTFEGAIFIGSYELSGETEGNMGFSVSIRLNDFTFTAE